MLMPKRVKHRKQHRGRRAGKASGGTVVSFGEFGLQAMESCWMTANQIEAARIAINRYIRRGGKIWIRVFPDKPFTKKPAETRMGSGKGAPDGWVAVIKPGRVLFELAGVDEDKAREAMRLATHKLPIHCRFIKRDVVSLAESSADEGAAVTEGDTAEPVEDADGPELKQAQIREQLREMDDEQLHHEIAAQREALYNFRRRHAMRQLDNTSAIRAARKQIARALTILRERELKARKEAK